MIAQATCHPGVAAVTVKDLLQGKPLRHPLHPMLVHLPIGLRQPLTPRPRRTASSPLSTQMRFKTARRSGADILGHVVTIACSGDNYLSIQEFCTHRFGPLSKARSGLTPRSSARGTAPLLICEPAK